MKVGESLCGDLSRWLRASSCFFSFSNGGNGPKGALTVKVASMVSYGFTVKVASMVSYGFMSNFGRGRILVIVDME